MSITFEKLKSPIYPAYLKVGDYSIALDDAMIASLKMIAEKDGKDLVEKIIEKVALNRYLRKMIEQEVKAGDPPDIIANRLRNEILAL